MSPIQTGLGFLYRASLGLKSRWRNLYYRALGVKISGYVRLQAVQIPRNWSDITLGSLASLDHGVVLLCSGPVRGDKLVIGPRTYVNRYTMFDAHEHLEVGQACMIGPHCYFTDANHGVASDLPVRQQRMQAAPLIIEDNVWVGAGVVVLAGTRVGRGAVIGAGSVVTSDIPPNVVAVGVPAQVLRSK
jgi:acetyltransferase-like isoleucine patch superfamily enzyme